MDTNKCFGCGEVGHIKRNCPNRKKGALNQKCHECGRHGHLMRQCPDLQAKSEGSAASASSTDRQPSRKAYSYPKTDIGFIDTHCHLEYVFERHRHSGTFDEFIHANSFPKNFEGCISTFCDPAAFSSFGLWEELLAQAKIWGSFGCHPHNAKYYNDSLEQRIVRCLERSQAIALGEIGLDYSSHCPSDHQVQKDVFIQQAKLAVQLNMPIQIHCRDAEADLLEILPTCIPMDWKVHLHCYTGTCDNAVKFLRMFPNLYIGFTGLVTFTKAREVHKCAFDVPLDRLLLETDAPYLTPGQVARRSRFSHPGMALFVAEEIAEIKKVTIDDVLLAARENTRKLYGI